MYKLFLLLTLLFLPTIVFAQQTTNQSVQKVPPEKTKTIALAPQEAKLLKQAIEKAKADSDIARLAQETARASNAEARALYFELKDKYKIDGDKWELAFDQEGLPSWVEKKITSKPVDKEQ